MLTGLTGPKTVGIPSAATIDKGVTGVCTACHSPMVPAQGVGSTGALVQRKRAGVAVAIPGSIGVLVVLHRVFVFKLVVLGGHSVFLLCVRDPEHGHRVALVAGVCSVAREGV